jgi:magnesium-transporting ATPase (P-type)
MITQVGRIAQLTQAVHEEPSPLQKELLRITRIITYIALALGVVIFLIGAFDIGLYPNKLAVFIFALGVLVAIVPEGLPATITLALAMAVQRLAQHGVLVKKLAVVEMMGTISMVCTDKSGTLTQNQMTVREIWVARQRLSVSGVGYEPKGEYFPKPSGMPFEADLTILLSAAMLCNNSRLNPPSIDQPQWTCLGDQTEAALRVAAQKGGIDGQQLQLLLPRVHELPFDARRKRMTTIHRDLRGETAFVKGAPREVLQLCTHILSHGEVGPLTEKLRAEILAANDEYARGALRVLALARRELPARTGAYTVEGVERELTFLGLMAMMDPPRPEVEQAVKTLRQADIRMVMITGDYGLTAESLARRVGLLSEAETLIMTGAELETLDDARLQALLDKEIIFARMAPEHKLRLVSAFQARGEVVVVTGDGVNDAPALRKADIGVSMGIIGTDVAKEAADIILTNDNFASIAEAIAEGRATFDNIRKFITYIFSSNVPEVAPFFATALWGIPLALSVKQILAIDLGTDLFPALALGTEKPEPDVMQRPPRRRLQPLLNRSLLIRAFLFLGIIEATLCFCGYYAVRVLLRPYESVLFLGLTIPGTAGLSSAELDLMSATVFHAGVVTSQVGNAFACRTDRNRGRALGWFSNRALLGGIAIEITIILALIYIPPLARMFDHLPLPPVYWVFLALYAPILYTLDWLRKAFVRWWERFTHSMKNDSAIHPDNGLGNDKAHAEADYQDQTTPSQEKGVQS